MSSFASLTPIKHKGHTLPAQSILVVEDSLLNAKLIQALLSGAAFVVTLAGSAEKALESLEHLTPDLILMDVQLPGMSGLDLTRLLKADPSKCGIPITALTANDSSGDRQTLMDAGCTGSISKPISPAHFAAQVRSLFVVADPLPPVSTAGSEYNQTETALQLKKSFLLEGARDSRVLLGVVEQGASDLVFIGRVLHRWIGCGDAAGIPEISARAERMRDLIPSKGPDLSALTAEAQSLKNLFDDELAAFVS